MCAQLFVFCLKQYIYAAAIVQAASGHKRKRAENACSSSSMRNHMRRNGTCKYAAGDLLATRVTCNYYTFL